MPVKIRLQRKGRRKRPFYHIVIADSRAPRDGRFIEKIGTYNPMTNPATIDLDRDAAFVWLQKGAQPTNTVRAILRYNGVLYRKHLQRGVDKEAMSQEDADKLYQQWVDDKDSITAERFEVTAKADAKLVAKISGTPPPPPKPEPEPEPEVAEAAAPAAEAETATKEATPVAKEEAPAKEKAPVAEAKEKTPVAPSKEEAPAAEAKEKTPAAPAKEEAPAAEATTEVPKEAAKVAGEAKAETEAAEAVAEALEENPQGAEDVAPEADGKEDKKEEA